MNIRLQTAGRTQAFFWHPHAQSVYSLVVHHYMVKPCDEITQSSLRALKLLLGVNLTSPVYLKLTGG